MNLVMMQIGTVFPARMGLDLYQVRTKFSYATDSTVPGPRIAKRAEYPLNKGDPEKGGEKELDMVIESDADDKFALKRKDFKCREIVIHVALLLEQNQQKTTKSFYVGLRSHVSSGILYRMHELEEEGEDIKLSFKPKNFGEHFERLVPKDLNLHELLLSWVGSERSVSASS